MGEVILFTKRVKNKMCKKKTPQYIEELRKVGENLVRPDMMNDAVYKIFDECSIDKVPINVSEIAEKLGFDIYYGKFNDESVSGSMWDVNEEIDLSATRKSKRFILVSDRDTAERQRFTIAHEIGHFVMHCTDERNFYERYHSNPDKTDPKLKKYEDDADFFAANLVLPSKLVIGYVMNNSGVDRSALIQKICTQFGVERETVTRRFKELGLEV